MASLPQGKAVILEMALLEGSGWVDRLAQRYTQALMANPKRTMLTTTTVSTVTANVLSQTLVEGNPVHHLDWKRLRRVLLASLVLSYSRYYQFQAINKILPPGSTSRVGILKALLLDQLVFAPLSNALFFVLMSLQQDKRPSWADIQVELRKKLWPSLLLYWRVWPAAKLVSFAFVPTPLRPLFGDFVGFMWAILLSTLTRQRQVK